jgi:hypothetical protein
MVISFMMGLPGTVFFCIKRVLVSMLYTPHKAEIEIGMRAAAFFGVYSKVSAE